MSRVIGPDGLLVVLADKDKPVLSVEGIIEVMPQPCPESKFQGVQHPRVRCLSLDFSSRITGVRVVFTGYDTHKLADGTQNSSVGISVTTDSVTEFMTILNPLHEIFLETMSFENHVYIFYHVGVSE